MALDTPDPFKGWIENGIEGQCIRNQLNSLQINVTPVFYMMQASIIIRMLKMYIAAKVRRNTNFEFPF
jgi:hypothetical protein